MSLACVLSLAIFRVLLQSWDLCLALGLARILSLSIFLGFATCQYIEASETFKFFNLGLVFCQSCELCTTLKLEEQEEEQEEEEMDDVLVVE